MIKWLKKWFPPGLMVEGQLALIVALLCIVSGWSFLVFRENHWDDVLKNCYVGFETWYHLAEEYEMPEFMPMLRNCFDILNYYLIAMVGLMLYNYRYHYNESKSVYLMKRLSNPWEFHRRCISVPLLGMVCGGILAVAMIGLFYIYYSTFVPPFDYEVGSWF